MKEITITKTKTWNEVIYQAIDGTKFTSKDECIKYDNTAKAVIMSEYNELIISRTNEYELLGMGNSDASINIVGVKNYEDTQVVKKALIYNNQWLTEESNKDRLINLFNLINEAEVKRIPLIVDRGYENDNFWITNTITGVIDKLEKFIAEPEEFEAEE